MSIEGLIQTLKARGVQLEVDGDAIRWRPSRAVTDDERKMLAEGKAEAIAVLRGLRRQPPMPSDIRGRVAWLAQLGRHAGLDGGGVFAVVDEMFPGHVTEPYGLSESETRTVGDRLKTEIGTRRPIEEAVVIADDSAPTVPNSIERKKSLGWTDDQFARFCQRHLGHPGLRSADDDRRILDAMPRARP